MQEWEVCLRLVLSCIMGGIIGYERQMRHKSAGLRTNMLVALGACLIMLLSQALYDNVEGKTNADPARLAAQVVSGIGFLGAGAIMKEGLTVTGLTTAATLWVVAGVGLAVGAGFYLGAGVTTGVVFLILWNLSRLDMWVDHDRILALSIYTLDRPGQIMRISACIEDLHLRATRRRRAANGGSTSTLRCTTARACGAPSSSTHSAKSTACCASMWSRELRQEIKKPRAGLFYL